MPAAEAQSPGRDQYIPSAPTATGKDDSGTSAKQSSNGSGSADDQALDRITGGGSSDGSGSKSKDKKSGSGATSEKSSDDESDGSRAIPPVGAGGGGDDDDGALSSVSGTLTDWDEPLVPGLVALVALFTLATSIVVLVRRRRSPGRGA